MKIEKKTLLFSKWDEEKNKTLLFSKGDEENEEDTHILTLRKSDTDH